MEEIMKKALDAGYKPSEMYLEETAYGADYQFIAISTDPLFWQALGKACKWEEDTRFADMEDGEISEIMTLYGDWKDNALKFYEINLTEGWDKAVEWLKDLIK